MKVSAQKALIDALSQHQAYLYRASTQSVNELTDQFNKLSNAQLLRLSELLADLTEPERKALQGLNFSSKGKASRNIEEIKAILNEWFKSIDQDLSSEFEKSAVSLAVYEASYTSNLIANSVAVVSGEKVYKTIKKTPYAGGQLVDYLFKDIASSLSKKVEYVIRDGIAQGQTNQQIIQRIKGKKSLDYKDGILKTTEYEIERQVRTARSHISTATYIDTYKALGLTHIKFVSVLDGRTSLGCSQLDQEVWEIDDPKIRRPPLHPNCRSTLIGVGADGNVAGARPFVSDERRVRDIPKDQRTGKIGQVDANTKFSDWFKTQDEDFQRTWLGKTRFNLYKKAEFPLDKFLDPLGRKYTLNELRVMDEKTFKNLGL